MSEKIHLHLGIGALGLGLICWCSSKYGFRVVAANRNGTEGGGAFMDVIAKSKRFELVYPTTSKVPEVSQEKITIPEVCAFDSPDLLKHITDERTVLLTTCLKGDAYADGRVQQLLAKLITARLESPTDRPLLFIACENGIKSSGVKKIILEQLTPALRQLLPDRIVFADCVVDRICNKPYIENNDVKLVVENHASWLIENPKNDATINTLFPSQGHSVTIVPYLKPFEAQKRIIVNGAHLSIALNAHRAGSVAIDDFVKETGGTKILEGLLDELQLLFLDWQTRNFGSTPPISDQQVIAFANHVRERLSIHPQLVQDATTRFKKDKLQQFFADYHRKVGDDVLAYSSGNDFPLYYVPRALYMASELISQQRFVH